MAIGGLAGLTLAGLAGGPQGFLQAQKQQDDLKTAQILNAIRQRGLQDAQREDQARSALFGALASPDQSGIAGLSALGGVPATTSPPGIPGSAPVPPQGGAASTVYGGSGAGGATPIRVGPQSTAANVPSSAADGAPVTMPGGSTFTPSKISGDQALLPNDPDLGGGFGTKPVNAAGIGTTQGSGFQSGGIPGVNMAATSVNQADPVVAQVGTQAKETAQKAVTDIPQLAWGRMSLTALAQQIDKANPGADPVVKMMALEQANKLLAPVERQQWQMYLLQNRQEFQLEVERIREDFRHREAQLTRDAATARQDKSLEAAGERPSGPLIQRGNDYYQQDKSGKWNKVDLPGEGPITKVGAASQGAVKPEVQDLMANGIANYQLPPMSGWALKSPNGQSVMARVMQINPEYDATKYTGKQREQSTFATRSANLGMNTAIAEEEIPLALATSEKIDRTQFPTINSLIIAADKGTGGEDVVRFLDQINALKYTYAAALSRSGVQTVDAMRRFDNIMDTNWAKGQVAAGLDQIKQTLAAERRGIERARGEIGGGLKSGAQPAQPANPMVRYNANGDAVHWTGTEWAPGAQ